MLAKPSTGKKLGVSKQSPTLLESSTKPKGFPMGSKRLQPIKPTDLKNSDLVASPKISNTSDSKKEIL